MPMLVTPTTDTEAEGSAVFQAADDHVTTALGRLIERWRADAHPNIAALLSSYVEQCQELENHIWFTIYGRTIEYAEGEQLNMLGRLVGQPRNGVSDDVYRARIAVRIRVNQSIGTPKDIIEMLRLLTDATFRLVEFGTASFAVHFSEPLEDAGAGYAAPGLVAETRAAGVSGMVTMPVGTTGRSAFFGSSYDPALNATIGFSSAYDSDIGGLWSHAARA